MIVSYDLFTKAFLAKVTEYNFMRMYKHNRQELVDGYMKRACARFNEVCVHDLTAMDDTTREFTVDDMPAWELDEIVDIVSDGMLEQWFRQHMYKQENLENLLNTSDFTSYSPAELTYRITNAYNVCKKDFVNRMREYSYRHGDLTKLHL
jgi:HD superfamily phosphohydrolase